MVALSHQGGTSAAASSYSSGSKDSPFWNTCATEPGLCHRDDMEMDDNGDDSSIAAESGQPSEHKSMFSEQTTQRVRHLVEGYIMGPFKACVQPPLEQCGSGDDEWSSSSMAPSERRCPTGRAAYGTGAPWAPPAPHLMSMLPAAPSETDILCGRGRNTNQHPGNKHFRQLVAAHQSMYLRLSKKQKMLLARRIVEIVLDSGARFVARTENGGWADVGMPRSLEKTSQALREKTGRTDASACEPPLPVNLDPQVTIPDVLKKVYEPKKERKSNRSVNPQEQHKRPVRYPPPVRHPHSAGIHHPPYPSHPPPSHFHHHHMVSPPSHLPTYDHTRLPPTYSSSGKSPKMPCVTPSKYATPSTATTHTMTASLATSRSSSYSPEETVTLQYPPPPPPYVRADSKLEEPGPLPRVLAHRVPSPVQQQPQQQPNRRRYDSEFPEDEVLLSKRRREHTAVPPSRLSLSERVIGPNNKGLVAPSRAQGPRRRGQGMEGLAVLSAAAAMAMEE